MVLRWLCKRSLLDEYLCKAPWMSMFCYSARLDAKNKPQWPNKEIEKGSFRKVVGSVVQNDAFYQNKSLTNLPHTTAGQCWASKNTYSTSDRREVIGSNASLARSLKMSKASNDGWWSHGNHGILTSNSLYNHLYITHMLRSIWCLSLGIWC